MRDKSSKVPISFSIAFGCAFSRLIKSPSMYRLLKVVFQKQIICSCDGLELSVQSHNLKYMRISQPWRLTVFKPPVDLSLQNIVNVVCNSSAQKGLSSCLFCVDGRTYSSSTEAKLVKSLRQAWMGAVIPPTPIGLILALIREVFWVSIGPTHFELQPGAGCQHSDLRSQSLSMLSLVSSG